MIKKNKKNRHVTRDQLPAEKARKQPITISLLFSQPK